METEPSTVSTDSGTTSLLGDGTESLSSSKASSKVSLGVYSSSLLLLEEAVALLSQDEMHTASLFRPLPLDVHLEEHAFREEGLSECSLQSARLLAINSDATLVAFLNLIR